MEVLIVFPNGNGGLVFAYPCDKEIAIEELARKDVPAGVPFLLLTEEQNPKDHTFFDAFEADFSNPDGYGIGPQAWNIEQYEKEIAQLNHDEDSARISQLRAMIAVQQSEMQA